jgi:hypothetical protein
MMYTIGRVFAVATRPLALFFANNYLQSNVAENLAVAFLASAVALAATAADPHRRFYLERFSGEQRPRAITYYTYVAALALLFVIGAVLVLGLVLRFTASLPLAAAAVVYFASDKIADELLRFKLFQKDLPGWGGVMTARSVLQLCALGALVLVAGTQATATGAVCALALGNLLVFVPRIQLPGASGLQRAGTILRLSMRGVRLLRASIVLWMFSLLSAGIGYIDRLLALVVDKATLPLFMLVVMCYSIVQMAVDFYYLSQHRRDFLEQRITVAAALASRRFVGSLGAGLVVASIAATIVLTLSRNGDEFPLAYILLIATLQCAFAMVVVPQQILYWKDRLRQMLRLDIAFCVVFAAAALVAWRLDGSLTVLLLTAGACALLRLALYLYAAHAARSGW